MLTQFILQVGEADAVCGFNGLNLDIVNGAPCYCNNLTVSASFWVSLLFSWMPLCQDQATCAQSQGLTHKNSPTLTKKLLRYALKHLLNFTDKNSV